MMTKERKDNNIEIFFLLFLAFEWGSRNLGAFLRIQYEKGFLSVIVSSHFAMVITE